MRIVAYYSVRLRNSNRKSEGPTPQCTDITTNFQSISKSGMCKTANEVGLLYTKIAGILLISRSEFEPVLPTFEQPKIAHESEHVAIWTGGYIFKQSKLCETLSSHGNEYQDNLQATAYFLP